MRTFANRGQLAHELATIITRLYSAEIESRLSKSPERFTQIKS